jgi:hypothetical protein
MSPERDSHRVGDDNGRTTVKGLFRQFQERARNAPGKPIFTGSSFVGRVERLLPETAWLLAEDYFKVLSRDPRSD